MGRLSMPQKRKRDNDVFTVDRVWDRMTEDDGTVKYLTSWKGYSEKTWEPIEHFTDEAKEMVRDLERILDDPDNHPKPEWLLQFEEMKKRGVNVLKRTPGYNRNTAGSVRGGSTSRGASTDPPASKRERREDSGEPSRRSARSGRLTDAVNYSDVLRRKGRGEEHSTTPQRVQPSRAAAAAANAATAQTGTPERSGDSSRASTRHGESDRAESEDEGASTSAMRPPEEPKDESSSSTIAADETKASSELKVVVNEPPATPTSTPLPHASPAVASSALSSPAVSYVITPEQIDPRTGILLPLEPREHEVFDWEAHIAANGGEVAPIECFWKRRLGKFVNPFGEHIGKVLKVPDDDHFQSEWCTVGTVIAVHGPWVKIHALDTDLALAEWYMADDAGVQEFISLNDEKLPKCKEPNKRRSTGNYKKMVDKAAGILHDGNDMRVPSECFERQLSWKNRPVKNLFKVGHKLETYDPVRGDGSFYPSTIVEVHPAKEQVTYHYDGYPASSGTEKVSYNDTRMFPCGFAAAIGWKCVLPESFYKKSENRGRKKTSVVDGDSPPALITTARPSAIAKPPNNNNEKPGPSAQHRRSGDSHLRTRPTTSYKETPEEDTEDEDEEEEDDKRYVSHSQPHRTRAPAIPGLMKRVDETKVKVEVKSPPQSSSKVEVRPKEEAPVKKPHSSLQQQQRPAQQTTSTRHLSPLTMGDFEEHSSSAETELPITSYSFQHTGDQVWLFLNHECNVGVNIHPAAFKHIPSKLSGSLPHIWREILQQLLNASVDSRSFVECLPKNTLSNSRTLMSITYDDTPISTVGHYIMPPPNMPRARELMALILKKANMCPNALQFDARKPPPDKNVMEILRRARVEQQNLQQGQAGGQPAARQLSAAAQRQIAELHKQQMAAAHMQAQQRAARTAQMAAMAVEAHPPVQMVAPSSSMQQPRPQQVVPPLQPPPLQHTVQIIRPAPPPVAPPPVAAPPVELDDPERFLRTKINLKTLTEDEIIGILNALKVPDDVIAIFERRKINWRSLSTLTSEIMQKHLAVPEKWANIIHSFIRSNL